MELFIKQNLALVNQYYLPWRCLKLRSHGAGWKNDMQIWINGNQFKHFRKLTIYSQWNNYFWRLSGVLKLTKNECFECSSRKSFKTFFSLEVSLINFVSNIFQCYETKKINDYFNDVINVIGIQIAILF